MPFSFTRLKLDGLVLVEPRAFADERGFFMECYKASDFLREGIGTVFVQDNHSRSTRGVLRGLHFQHPPSGQAKLVRAISGSVWDVAVDLRQGSPTYAQWYGHELNDVNHLMLYIPEGFAHGFVTLSSEAHLIYKCGAEYDRERDGGIRWDDPDIAIEWPVREMTISEKDRTLPYLKDLP
jgi:dTDP-4-dehydrorhamnose 3,5-epimerase